MQFQMITQHLTAPTISGRSACVPTSHPPCDHSYSSCGMHEFKVITGNDMQDVTTSSIFTFTFVCSNNITVITSRSVEIVRKCEERK